MTPTVVGIAGGTASGKTTAAREIAKRLGEGCLWLTHDRYYRSMPAKYLDNPVEFNFDHPDALETSEMVAALRSLRLGQTALVPHYDFAHHRRRDRSEWETVAPAPLIIVEGILVLQDAELRACLDHKVFVHAPADIRLIRRIRRDVAHRARPVDEIIAQYERTVRPMHVQFVEPSRQFADLVIDGTTAVDSLVASVLELVGITPRREAP